MIDFLTANWWWILFLGAMFLMHAGHGGHGGGCGGGHVTGRGAGHGTSGEYERSPREQPVSLDKHAGHAHATGDAAAAGGATRAAGTELARQHPAPGGHEPAARRRGC